MRNIGDSRFYRGKAIHRNISKMGIRRLRGSELETINNVSDVEGIILFTKRRRDRAKKMGEKGRERIISGSENQAPGCRLSLKLSC